MIGPMFNYIIQKQNLETVQVDLFSKNDWLLTLYGNVTNKQINKYVDVLQNNLFHNTINTVYIMYQN